MFLDTKKHPLLSPKVNHHHITTFSMRKRETTASIIGNMEKPDPIRVVDDTVRHIKGTDVLFWSRNDDGPSYLDPEHKGSNNFRNFCDQVTVTFDSLVTSGSVRQERKRMVAGEIVNITLSVNPGARFLKRQEGTPCAWSVLNENEAATEVLQYMESNLVMNVETTT